MIAPIYPAIIEPKLMVDIRSAYIVPSMFLGHILQANTNNGMVLSSPTT